MKTVDCYSDAEIIQRLQEGDENAMKMLYKRHWKTLFLSAYHVLNDKETCEDIIQELFINIWNKRETLNISSSISAYLAAAVRYEVYRKVRSAKRCEPIVDEMSNRISAHTSQDNLELRDLQTQIKSVIDTLSPKCKDVYKLSRNEQLSHKEIAGRLNISTKTVRNHLTHALNILRVSLHQFIVLLILLIYR